MRHLVLLLVVSLLIYFSWAYATRKERKTVSKFLGRHTVFVVLIVFVLFGFLIWQYFVGSTKLL